MNLLPRTIKLPPLPNFRFLRRTSYSREQDVSTPCGRARRTCHFGTITQNEYTRMHRAILMVVPRDFNSNPRPPKTREVSGSLLQCNGCLSIASAHRLREYHL